jgi:sugar transferase (PEP-CTERM/EpsH1 system associated)
VIAGLEPGLFEHYICTMRGANLKDQHLMQEVTFLNAGGDGAAFQFNVPRLVRLMKQVRPAIVHSRNWGGIEAVIAARVSGVPVILHSEHGYELEMESGLPFHRRLLRHCAYRMGTAFATVTEELRSYHAKQAWWKPEDVRVLYNGVDLEKFRPRRHIREIVRREFGIPCDAFVVGSVGRMVALKDFGTLLKAAEILIAEGKPVHVLLVGSGPALNGLDQYASRSTGLADRVHFCQATPRVDEMLNAMDVFILPSLMEGMSNTLLEAMAVGLPVVASKVGGNPEIILDGECGYLFPPKAVTVLADLLRSLSQDMRLRKQIGQAARERVACHFSLEAMVERYRNLYLELLERQLGHRNSGIYVRN